MSEYADRMTWIVALLHNYILQSLHLQELGFHKPIDVSRDVSILKTAVKNIFPSEHLEIWGETTRELANIGIQLEQTSIEAIEAEYGGTFGLD